MDDWLAINSLPPILTMQLGLAPQLSLYVTPHWSLDTAIIARAPLLLPFICVLCMITELWLVIVMTLIVSTCPIWCMLSIRVVSATTFEGCWQTGAVAGVVGCLWLLSTTFWLSPGPSNVCQGGPGTMMPIWKQTFPTLDDLMDGEISSGCPAEPTNRNSINHPTLLSLLTSTHPNRDPQVKGSVKTSPVPYTHPLTRGKLIWSL